MVEEAYCIDILKRTMAVQAAIDRANSIILEDHLHTCVTTAIRAGTYLAARTPYIVRPRGRR